MCVLNENYYCYVVIILVITILIYLLLLTIPIPSKQFIWHGMTHQIPIRNMHDNYGILPFIFSDFRNLNQFLSVTMLVYMNCPDLNIIVKHMAKKIVEAISQFE